MPTKCAVPVEEAVKVIKRYMSYFITDSLPSWSSPVWKEISEEPEILKYKWSKESVRTNIKENRRNILSLAREECGYFFPKTSNKPEDINNDTLAEESEEDSDNNDDKNDEDYRNKIYTNERPDLETFDVVIDRKEWNHVIQISCGKNEDIHDKLNLRLRVWTDIFAYEFWKQYRLKCAFVFKKGSIHPIGHYYMTMEGRCKSKTCRNPLFGFIETDPGDLGPVLVHFQCRDTRNEQHEDCKRPLQGERREKLRKEVKEKGVLGTINHAANELLKPGDTQCPLLFSDNVLYQLHKESTKTEFGLKADDKRDLIKTIQNINNDQVYLNSILQVGDTPFFTFYMSPSQLHTYKEYRRIHRQDSSISIDATGGVVRQFIDTRQEKTSYIFLYQIVINFNGSTQSVYQMLSEVHDTNHIYLWLSRWIRLNINAPKQVVCDGARALLNAACLAFNGYTLSNYIRLCFKSALSCKPTNFIQTYIRIDTAHFIHAVSTWECWKSVVHKNVKSFYLYCIGLLIDCSDFESFERLATLILIISNTEYEDTIINYNNQLITPLEARNILEDTIAKDKTSELIDSYVEDINNSHFDDEKQKVMSEMENLPIVEEDKISSWLKKIQNNSLNVVVVGKQLNCFYVPKLAHPLKEKLKEFPLWSRVCINYTNLRATSSYVEEYFKDLKALLKKLISLPARVDIFIKAHLRMIIGGVKLFQSKLLKFIDDNVNPPMNNQNEVIVEGTLDDEDEYNLNNEICYENWKGHGNDPKHQKFNWVKPDPFYLTNNDNVKSSTNVFSNDSNKVDRKSNEMSLNNCNRIEKVEESNIIIADPNISIEQDHCYAFKPTMQLNNNQNDIHLDNAVKNVSIKRRKKEGKYFKACAEINFINKIVKNKKLKTTTKKQNLGRYNNVKILASNLLLNGICSGPVKWNDETWFAYNTCPYDSIVQLIFNGGLENHDFNNFLKSSVNQTFAFVSNFLQTGLSSDTYEQLYLERLKILHPIYKNTETMQMTVQKSEEGSDKENDETDNSQALCLSRVIDCKDNVNNLWKILFLNEPSLVENYLCLSQTCQDYQRSVPILTVDYNVINMSGFSALEKALNFISVTCNIYCKNCHKRNAILTKKLNRYIYIELDIPMLKFKESKECKLRDLPKYLNISESNLKNEERQLRYRLSGVIGYHGAHYIAYCQDLSSRWRFFNDMLLKPEPIGDFTAIIPHGALYILT